METERQDPAVMTIPLAVTMIFPATGYLAMFALLLFGPIQRLVSRLIRR